MNFNGIRTFNFRWLWSVCMAIIYFYFCILFNTLRENSLDYYAAVRSSYYQNRTAAIKNVDQSELTPAPIISVEFE